MAKLSTCPICGYTDTADDADALQSAIEEHIRLAHNLDPATLGTGNDVKNVSNAEAARATGSNYDADHPATPIIPIAATAGGAGAAPTAPNAVLAAGYIENDDTRNGTGPTANEHRNDETDNFS